MSDHTQEREPSEAMKQFLDRPFTFDMLRDPKWQPSREDYAALRDAARDRLEAAERERANEANRANQLRQRLDRRQYDLSQAEVRVVRLTARLEEAQEAIRQSPCSAFTHQSCLERAERGENPAGVRCPRCAYLEALAASLGEPEAQEPDGVWLERRQVVTLREAAIHGRPSLFDLVRAALTAEEPAS